MHFFRMEGLVRYIPIQAFSGTSYKCVRVEVIFVFRTPSWRPCFSWKFRETCCPDISWSEMICGSSLRESESRIISLVEASPRTLGLRNGLLDVSRQLWLEEKQLSTAANLLTKQEASPFPRFLCSNVPGDAASVRKRAGETKSPPAPG